jgi:hypothetical protein
LVGKRTNESGDVSFVFTDSARESEAKIFGAGKGAGVGGGAVSAGVLLGTEVSIEPLSNLPVRCAGAVGVPSFGIVRGPPGPLPGPILLFRDVPSLGSSSCTEIGVCSGCAIGNIAARKASNASIE